MSEVTPPRPYHGIALQRLAILARLRNGPATVAELERECNAPDPRARVHELRKREGQNIETCLFYRPNTDGTVNKVAAYVLQSVDHRQQNLFEPQ